MHNPDALKAGPVVVLWLLAGLFFPLQIVRGQATCAQEVAEIEAYCRKIDRLIKQDHNNRRAFASNSLDAEHGDGGWREIRTIGEDKGDSPNDSALVWSSQGRIAAVSFTFRSGSRDRVQSAMYYYRDDGTLARVSARLDLVRGQTTCMREQFYDRKGILISASTKSCSLRTGREQKPEKQFSPEPLPLYLTTNQLPFYQALAKE